MPRIARTQARNAHVILIIQISGSSRLIHPTPTSTSSAAAAAAAAAAARATGPLDLSSMRAASTLHPFLQLQGCQKTLYVIHFKIEIYNVLARFCNNYRVTALNVTRIWIEWAGRLAFGYMAKSSLSGLRFMPSPGIYSNCMEHIF